MSGAVSEQELQQMQKLAARHALFPARERQQVFRSKTKPAELAGVSGW